MWWGQLCDFVKQTLDGREGGTGGSEICAKVLTKVALSGVSWQSIGCFGERLDY